MTSINPEIVRLRRTILDLDICDKCKGKVIYEIDKHIIFSRDDELNIMLERQSGKIVMVQDDKPRPSAIVIALVFGIILIIIGVVVGESCGY